MNREESAILLVCKKEKEKRGKKECENRTMVAEDIKEREKPRQRREASSLCSVVSIEQLVILTLSARLGRVAHAGGC